MTTSIDATALAASLRRLEKQQANTVLEESLQRVVDACAQMFDISGSGLMLADEHSELRYAVFTDPTSRLLENAQLETGEGPCVDTFVHDAVTATTDVQNDERWTQLAGVLDGSGIRAVLGVPVHLSGIPVASLDIYLDREHRWEAAEQHALSRFGDVAEAMLATAVSAEQAGVLAAQLNYALDYRVPIERGVGFLMSRENLDHVAAFHRLRTAARSTRRKIGDVAQTLLDTGRLPGEEP
ncbi:GAF and ANTAR domain-containing protein [Nakamurella deserti]|uniref:GAF and ANTAR domain-containing protein n=1 Tax=Nakamurella deserti TaxID=2164074 RepID=UPI000DBE4559|nr:GAF and ANTAR domain-containing protein [Nakamurella deserti]